ncbi:MAG: DMT family transporter [Lachnospiraceae bacterium]|nr:DMT family transporter [Lachnospiraceae bacterium]
MDQTKSKNIMENPVVVTLCALLCCALWGTAFPGIKLGYEWTGVQNSDTATQILYAGIRFTLAGILVIIIGSCAQKKNLLPNKKAIYKIIILAIFQTIVQYLFFYVGLARTTGVKSSIITSFNVFGSLLISAFVFHQEKLTMKKVVGCAIGFMGVVLVNLTGGSMDTSLHFAGEGFIFISAMSYALSSGFIKKFGKEEDPVMLSGYQFLLGGLFLFLVGGAFGGHVSFLQKNGSANIPAISMILYLAMVSAVAYSLWGILLKHNPISRVAIFGFTNPIFGVVLSALLLDEKDSLGVGSIVALVLVCMGIFIVNKVENIPIEDGTSFHS